MSQFIYSGVARNFIGNSGVFLCSDTGIAATPGVQSNPCWLAYQPEGSEGLIDDITPIAFLSRVAVEIGQVIVNSRTISYTLPWQLPQYDGSAFIPATAVRTTLIAIAQAQHTGALCRLQTASGDSWLGALLLTPESFRRLPGGSLKVDASWVQVS